MPARQIKVSVPDQASAAVFMAGSRTRMSALPDTLAGVFALDPFVLEIVGVALLLAKCPTGPYSSLSARNDGHKAWSSRYISAPVQ